MALTALLVKTAASSAAGLAADIVVMSPTPEVGGWDSTMTVQKTASVTPCEDGSLTAYFNGLRVARAAPPRSGDGGGLTGPNLDALAARSAMDDPGAGRYSPPEPGCCPSAEDAWSGKGAWKGQWNRIAAHSSAVVAAVMTTTEPPAEVEVVTVDVSLGSRVQEKNQSIASGIASALGVPAARVEVLPESYPLPAQRQEPILAWNRRAALAPVASSSPSPSSRVTGGRVAERSAPGSMVAQLLLRRRQISLQPMLAPPLAFAPAPTASSSPAPVPAFAPSFAPSPVPALALAPGPAAMAGLVPPPTVPPDVLRVSFIIENLDFALLIAIGLHTQLEASIKQALASELSIKPESISLKLLSDSAVVEASLLPSLSGLIVRCGQPVLRGRRGWRKRRRLRRLHKRRKLCGPNSERRQLALRVMKSDGLGHIVEGAILGVKGVDFAFRGPVMVSDVSVEPSSTDDFGGLKPSRIQLLSRDPCLVRQLRAEGPVFRRVIAQQLGIAPQRLLIEPPAAVDEATTARALALLQRGSCDVPPHRHHPRSEAPTDPKQRLNQPDRIRPAAGLLARSGSLRGDRRWGVVASPAPGGAFAPAPTKAVAHPATSQAPTSGDSMAPPASMTDGVAFGPMGGVGVVPRVPTTPSPEVNRPWIAWWSIGIFPPRDKAAAMQLISAIDTPHGPLDSLLPLTLARVPGLAYPSFARSRLQAVELPAPRNVALHLGPVPGGDRHNDLAKAALDLQAKAQAELRYSQTVRKAIQQEEAHLTASFTNQQGLMEQSVVHPLEVAPAVMFESSPESPYGPWAPGEIPWDVSPGM